MGSTSDPNAPSPTRPEATAAQPPPSQATVGPPGLQRPGRRRGPGPERRHRLRARARQQAAAQAHRPPHPHPLPRPRDMDQCPGRVGLLRWFLDNGPRRILVAKPGRRGNGEGGIFQLADGDWRGFITLGYDADGKQVRSAAVRQDAQGGRREAQRIAAQSGSRLDPAPGEGDRRGVAAALRGAAPRRSCGPARARSTSDYLNRIVEGAGRHAAAAPHAAARSGSFYAELMDAGLSPSTRQHIHHFFKAALREALRLELVERTPFDVIDAPKGGRIVTPRVWDPAEVRTFLAAAEGDRLYGAFYLMVTLGLRVGETMAPAVEGPGGRAPPRPQDGHVRGQHARLRPAQDPPRRPRHLPRLRRPAGPRPAARDPGDGALRWRRAGRTSTSIFSTSVGHPGGDAQRPPQLPAPGRGRRRSHDPRPRPAPHLHHPGARRRPRRRGRRRARRPGRPRDHEDLLQSHRSRKRKAAKTLGELLDDKPS